MWDPRPRDNLVSKLGSEIREIWAPFVLGAELASGTVVFVALCRASAPSTEALGEAETIYSLLASFLVLLV